MKRQANGPKGVRKLLQAITFELPQVLKTNLFGIYVYGSLTYNAFDVETSDVDIVVVLKRQLNKIELNSLKEFYSKLRKINKWGRNLEISLVEKSKIFVPHMVYQSVNDKLVKVNYSDAFNPITWINIKKSGIALYGLLPKKWVPEISMVQLHRALQREVGYVEKEIIQKLHPKLWEHVYWILTLCRILFTSVNKTLSSKKEAGLWAIKNLDKKWLPGIKKALKLLHVKTYRTGTNFFKNFLSDFTQYIKPRIN